MRALRRRRGTTLIEVMISSALAVVILGGATMLLQSTQTLADSSEAMSASQTRVDRVLWPLMDDLRRASLASAETRGGNAFVDGTTDTGIAIQLVEGYSGDVVRGSTIDYIWEVPTGDTEGTIVRVQDGTRRILARHIEAFNVVRAGSVFTVSMTSVSGPADDRARRAEASISVSPRNP